MKMMCRRRDMDVAGDSHERSKKVLGTSEQ